MLNQPDDSASAPSCAAKTVIVGIYGISGAGKTYLLNNLEKSLGNELFSYYEGANEIASLVDGGLDQFNELSEERKTYLRELAISNIREDCSSNEKTGIVAGHFAIWSEETKAPVTICTKADLQIFTHIIYLDVKAELVTRRRQNQPSKQRSDLSIEELRMWQDAEKASLRDACYQSGILFSVLTANNIETETVATLVLNFRNYTEEQNMMRLEARLHQTMASRTSPTNTILVFDADRTLSPVDTGEVFWHYNLEKPEVTPSSLKEIFASPLRYSHGAFRQAALFYHECFELEEFDKICEKTALGVDLYPEMISLLHEALNRGRSGVFVATSGLQLVWEKILTRHGFSSIVVIGSGRLDDFVVDGKAKAAMVQLLRETYGVRVTAFGDSPLDLQMLQYADQAVVVVGDETKRSKRMDLELGLAIQDGALKAEQAVLCPGASPRLNTQILPIVSLNDPNFLDGIFHANLQPRRLRIIDTTDRCAAKILMTPMRDASSIGPSLRAAHHRVGWYLATEILSGLLNIEEYAITHVQGHSTTGYRVKNQHKTLIVALMRGGEPMALGVNDAMPSATFLHAKIANDVTPIYLEHASIVILVDSVINNGTTMIEFVKHIHKYSQSIKIVMLAGVVQSESIAKLKSLLDATLLSRLSLVGLRISTNKYTGEGGTDTGNRLYNTTLLN